MLLVVASTSSTASTTCSVTGKEPGQPEGAIRFCSMFSSNTCCDPAIDSEIQGYYNDMLGNNTCIFWSCC